MEKIIIVGYPKSGNTWVTRLTAELINCPVAGFLYQDNNPEIAREGFERKSRFICYKSHHQLSELKKEDLKKAKIIYVLRDPRDIIVSGRSYFYNYKLISQNIKSYRVNHFGKKIFYSSVFRRILGNKIMKRMMIKAILKGNSKINHWCRIPWNQHIQSYLNFSGSLKIKYEDLLNDPAQEARRILRFIGVNRTDSEINLAIENQSFETVIKRYNKNNELTKLKHLRTGKHGNWKNELSKREKKLVQKCLSSQLINLGYSIEK